MTPTPQEPNQLDTQTVIIAIGTVLIVFLTVLIAIFLASRDVRSPNSEATPDETITPLSPTASSTSEPEPALTPTLVLATSTNTPEQVVTTPTPSAAPGQATTTVTPSSSPIVIPSATPTLLPTVCRVKTDWAIYIVRPDDTLASLAIRTNTSVEALRQANCLPNTTIIIGQQIYLPFAPPTLTPTPTLTPLPTATYTPTLPSPTHTSTSVPTQPSIDLGTPTPTLANSPPVEIP